MTELQLTKVPFASTGMLIRKPAHEVFEAIVNPELTTHFWFTKSSGRLEVGQPMQWDWEMYNVSIEVTATNIDPDERIVINWPGYSGPTTVEWTFTPLQDGTFVDGNGDDLVKFVAESTQGFCLDARRAQSPARTRDTAQPHRRPLPRGGRALAGSSLPLQI